MALPTKTITWNNLQSSVGSDMDKTIKDGVFNKNLLLEKLNAKKKIAPGGEDITEPIMYAEGTVESSTGYDELTVADKELITTGRFQWAEYVATISISETEQAKNQGPTKIFDLLEAKYYNAKETLSKTLTTGIFGTGVVATYGKAPIVGLQAAVADDPTTNPTAGNYGAIDRTTTPGSTCYRNQYYDLTSLATITMNKLQHLWGISSDGNRHPDLIVTTQDIYDQVWSLADARQRLGNEEAAKLGYQS